MKLKEKLADHYAEEKKKDVKRAFMDGFDAAVSLAIADAYSLELKYQLAEIGEEDVDDPTR
jgi:hypothetical protein